MNCVHLTADLPGCKTNHSLMTDAEKLRDICIELVALSGLTAVHDLFYQFEPAENEDAGGVTGTVLLAESHLGMVSKTFKSTTSNSKLSYANREID